MQSIRLTQLSPWNPCESLSQQLAPISVHVTWPKADQTSTRRRLGWTGPHASAHSDDQLMDMDVYMDAYVPASRSESQGMPKEVEQPAWRHGRWVKTAGETGANEAWKKGKNKLNERVKTAGQLEWMGRNWVKSAEKEANELKQMPEEGSKKWRRRWRVAGAGGGWKNLRGSGWTLLRVANEATGFQESDGLESDGGRGMWYGGIAVNLASSTCSVLSGLGRVGRIN